MLAELLLLGWAVLVMCCAVVTGAGLQPAALCFGLLRIAS